MIQQIISLVVFFAVAFFILANFAILLYAILIFMVLSTLYYWFNKARRQFSQPPPTESQKPGGRIIDSDEWRKL